MTVVNNQCSLYGLLFLLKGNSPPKMHLLTCKPQRCASWAICTLVTVTLTGPSRCLLFFFFFSNCQLSASNHKMLPAVWLKHKKASQCSSQRRTRSDNRDERLTDGPCLIFIVNRFLTTCLECGKEIYGLVLRQAAMEGLGKEKKTENGKREQAYWTARKLLTLVLWKPISKIMRKNKPRNKLYLSSCLTNNRRILLKERNKMKREHFWFRDTEFSFDWSEMCSSEIHSFIVHPSVLSSGSSFCSLMRVSWGLTKRIN